MEGAPGYSILKGRAIMIVPLLLEISFFEFNFVRVLAGMKRNECGQDCQ